jgi:hypothetical protein
MAIRLTKLKDKEIKQGWLMASKSPAKCTKEEILS